MGPHHSTSHITSHHTSHHKKGDVPHHQVLDITPSPNHAASACLLLTYELRHPKSCAKVREIELKQDPKLEQK